METIASRLSALRAFAGLNATELGELAGLSSPAHVGLIERGERPNVAATTAIELARVLGTTAEYLIAGRGSPPTADAVLEAVACARTALPAIPHTSDEPVRPSVATRASASLVTRSATGRRPLRSTASRAER